MPQSLYKPHSGCGGKFTTIQNDELWYAQKCLKCKQVVRQKKRQAGR